jgi:hypothetical protein
MDEQSLLLENPLSKMLLVEDERSDWVNPIFDERTVASFILCSQCCWSKHQNFLSILEWSPRRSGTSYIILGHIQGVTGGTDQTSGVPYVKLYRYNPKHLCPKLNGFLDNGN